MKRLRKYLVVGIERIRLGLHRFVDDGLRSAHFIHPHDDGAGRIDRHNANNDDDDEEQADSQANGDHPKMTVGVNRLAPDLGVLGPASLARVAGSLISFLPHRPSPPQRRR